MSITLLKFINRIKVSLLFLLVGLLSGCVSGKFEFKEGDRIAFIGNALAERMQYYGFVETYLQAAYPEKELVFRNLGFTGDQVAHRPRAHKNYGDADEHLTKVRANVIFAFFGYNESFDNDTAKFGREVREWIDSTSLRMYDGRVAPRIVLFSPIAHEDLKNPDLPSGEANNLRLQRYTKTLADVAIEKQVVFINLFESTKKLYEESEEPLTINGIHLNEEGNRQVAQVIVKELTGSLSRVSDRNFNKLRQAVLNKNGRWFNRYRATDGNDIWGSRSTVQGNFATLQRELVMLDSMTVNRDKRIWKIARGERDAQLVQYDEEPFWGAWESWLVDSTIDDSNVPEPVKVASNFEQDVVYLSREAAIEKMHIAEGLEVNLFASEEKFPEIANPVTVKRDTEGRIWVAAWETYPMREPLKEMKDRLVVLTDADQDGVADEATTFARVHNPTGFEFWNGGVIVVSAPNILFLKDTDGDGLADVREILLGGIDAADTHHTANNLFYGPDGFIYYQRGIFMVCNVETPWRKNYESTKSGLFRFNPRTFQFDFVVENSPNPHGISFDKWGYQFITDGTSGRNYQVYLDPEVPGQVGPNDFKSRTLTERRVRPVPGNQVLSSTHFPPEYENNFLIYNVIGFRGIRRYQLQYENGAVQGKLIGDLMFSDDPNFRPTSGVIGADGALYISDWHNPLIGHLQHNIRDPKRDHEHGRIYRITAVGQPLMDPVTIAGEPVEKLLELLRHPVNEIRHQVQIELSGRDREEVIGNAKQWVKQFDASDEAGAHAMLEVLWLNQRQNRKDLQLLGQLMTSPIEHARIAAQRVEWFWKYHDQEMAVHAAPNSRLSGNEESTGHEGHNTSAQALPGADDVETGKSVDLLDENEAIVTVKAVPERMLFDIAEIKVRSGQRVKLTLQNPDFMPHNLVIVSPGAADEIAQLAIAMGGVGFEKDFVPESTKVLHATKLVNNKEEQTLRFTAPSEPGTYPFLCTFPGHGTLMRGIIKVVN